MNITIFNNWTKTWITRKGSCAFEMHGETWAAHKALHSPDDKPRWTVAHVGTGFSLLNQGYDCSKLPTTRAAALALAKANLEHRTTEAVKAAVERAMARIEEIVVEHGGPKC
jgi:hypothetical protein